MSKIIINNYITADPNICHGKPAFKETRIMVWQILEMLTAGKSAAEILKSFPSLNRKHIAAALDYATSLTKENYVIINTQSSNREFLGIEQTKVPA